MNHYSQALEALKSQPDHELKQVGDQWQTPKAIAWGLFHTFAPKIGPVVIDVFADECNNLVANYYTAAENALLQDLAGDCRRLGGAAYGNPPYSIPKQDDNGNPLTGMENILNWCREQRDAGAKIMLLIKAATSDGWWPEDADFIQFIAGRIAFEVPAWYKPRDPKKDKPSASGFASAVMIWDKEWKWERRPIERLNRDDLITTGNILLTMIEQRASELAQQYASATIEQRPDDAEPGELVSNPYKLPEPELSTNALQLPDHIVDANEMVGTHINEGSKASISENTESETQPELSAESDQQTEPELAITEEPAAIVSEKTAPIEMPVVEFTSEQIAEQLASGKITFDGDHLALMLQLDGMFGKSDKYTTKQIKAAILAHDEPSMVSKTEPQQKQNPEPAPAKTEKATTANLNGRSLDPHDHYEFLGIPEEMQTMLGNRVDDKWYMGCASVWILKHGYHEKKRPYIQMPSKMVAKTQQYYPRLEAWAPLYNPGDKRVLIGTYTSWEAATQAVAQYISENEQAEKAEAESAHKWPAEVTQIVHCAITAEQYQQTCPPELFERLCESANKMLLSPGSTTLAVSQHVKAMINDHRKSKEETCAA